MDDIIRAIANGDRAAFQWLYDTICDKVYNTALCYTQNNQDAEEITQDVFVSIYRNAAKFRGDAALHTWVYRITINACLNHLKRKKRFAFLRPSDTNLDRPDFDHPGILLENKENARILFSEIETLPDNQKTAFILSFIEELPRQEVADVMEITLKAVESLLQRAKKNLRHKLKKRYPHRRKSSE